MSALPHPVSAADLIRLGFDESTAEEAAQEIAELVHAIFGPFDPVAEEVWRRAEERELGPADLSSLFADAAEAGDPLQFLGAFPDLQARLEQFMRVRWSSRRARSLGHPTILRGQTWASLSEVAQEEVRDGLRHLSGYERGHVRRGPPQRSRLDTFLLALAPIVARHTGYRFHEMGLSSHLEGDFIGLAEVALSQLPPLPSGKQTPRPPGRAHRRGALPALAQDPQARGDRICGVAERPDEPRPHPPRRRAKQHNTTIDNNLPRVAITLLVHA